MQKEERIEYLNVNEIKPDPNQPRQTWTKEDIEEIERMVESLKEHGVIDPIEIDENNIIILGERRWKACKIAKVKVPIRRKTNLPPTERFERQIIADSQRKDLSSMDRAWAFATDIANINTGKNYTVRQIKRMPRGQLLTLVADTSPRTEKGTQKPLGQAELSRRTGIPQQTISMYLKTIDLEPEVQKAIDEKRLPLTVATEISRLDKEPELKQELQRTIVKEVEEAEKKPKRDQVRELVSFVKKPEVEIPFTKQKIEAKLSKEDKKALVQRKITPDEIKMREISKTLQPSPEVQEKIRESIRTTEEEVKKLREIPEVKERGQWYANWLAHGALIQALGGAFCPICGLEHADPKKLGWLCHSLPLDKAYKDATDEYQKRVK